MSFAASRLIGAVLGSAAVVLFFFACSGDDGTAPTPADSGTDGPDPNATLDGSPQQQDTGSFVFDSAGGGDAKADDAASSCVASADHLNDVTALALGDEHACALRVGGSVVCWGDNSYGQLATPISVVSATAKPLTVTFPNAVTIKAIAVGSHSSYAIDSAGALWAWGGSENGQLGAGITDAIPHPTPQKVATASGAPIVATDVAAGAIHTCARDPQGKVLCWGKNANGSLGPNSGVADGAIANRPVDAFNGVAALDAGTGPMLRGGGGGGVQTCLWNTAAARCWGNGRLFPINTDDTLYADLTDAGGAIPVKSMGIGTNHLCFIDKTNSVYCAGDNTDGQLGPSAAANTTYVSPLKVPNLTATIAGGGYLHTCVVTSTRTVQCFGSNQSLALGRGASFDAGGSSTPATVVDVADGGGASLAKVIDVVGGTFFTCAIVEETCGALTGAVVCWGDNKRQQIGVPATTSYSAIPVRIAAP